MGIDKRKKTRSFEKGEKLFLREKICE